MAREATELSKYPPKDVPPKESTSPAKADASASGHVIPDIPAAPEDLPPPELSENAARVLENRYLAKDKATGEVFETAQGLFWRVAASVAAPEYRELGKPVGEKWARRYYELMATGTFMPNSPTLMNAGREMGMLSACFVLPVEDSIEGIFETLKHVALIQKAGGGTGFSFSRLRPDGDIVATSGGRTSGPLSFIDAYSAGTDAIQQGAFRRGANMGVMRCDHPDVVEFVRAKDDLARWTNYNVSVAVTEDWMQRIVDSPEEKVVVINPHGGRKAWLRKCDGRRASQPDYESFAAGEEQEGSEYWTYGEVMDLIVHYAWKNGEPGMLFLDRANADNQVPNLGEYEATNPCVTGDAWVLTEEGPRQARDLIGAPTAVAVNEAWRRTSARGFFKTGTKPVVELRTAEGHRLRLTEDHRVRKVSKRTRWRLESAWTPAGELQPGDEVVLHDHRGLPEWEGSGTAEEGYLLGLLLGDGCLREQAATLSVWSAVTATGERAPGAAGVIREAERCLATLPHRADFGGFHEVAGRGEWRASSASLRDLAGRYGMEPGAKAPDDAIEATSAAFHRRFLRGLFDADGSVQGNPRKGVSVRLAQSDRGVLERAQRMLLRLGIASKIYARRAAGEAVLPDGRGGSRADATRAQYELVVARDNLAVFADRVGFSDAGKNARLAEAAAGAKRAPVRERFVATVEAVAPAGTEDVFDVEVPGPNAFDANGLYVHNCGEQWLLPYGSCNLGSVNLGKFYREGSPEAAPWEERVDWEEFDRAVTDCVRFLDDVVTINNYPIPEIRQRADEERRIGLGVMGFADLLYKLGVRYGSEQSFAIGRAFSERLTEQAYAASERLVAEEEREPFGAWKGSKPEVEGKAPRRNSHVSTVAPTGTISIIAGCSGGVEPLFSLAFQRQVMKDVDGVPVVMKEVNPDFRAALEKEGLDNEGVAEVVDRALEDGTISGTELSDEIKEVFVTAHDVKAREHILMQAAWQTSIDNAVSKTINLSRTSNEDDVRTAYLLAWREGCKGITVYRDGCREMQPMALKEKKKAEAEKAAAQPAQPGAFENIQPVPLPEIMPSVRVRQLTPFGNMHVKISVEPRAEREMEVFAQLGKGGDVANSDLEGVCRMISLFLRCGGGLRLALKQLEGIGSSLTVPSKDGRIMSLADGLAKALRKYLNAKERYGLRAMLLGEVDPAEESLESAPAPASNGARMGSGIGGAFKIKCPACESAVLIFEEGCCKCPGCGFSQC